MPADGDDRPDARTVDPFCLGNFRISPHPISTDPRLDPIQLQGDDQGRDHDNVDVFTTRIPRRYINMSPAVSGVEYETVGMKCCCGRLDCAYLEHNNAALGGLERDLENAARLGQALLSRHESYINESQAEHARLSTCLTDLETEKHSLQDANDRIVAENRELLHQLEHLNSSLADSDEDVKRLESLLLDCESEVRRLNGLVRKTEELDGRIQEMENERHLLNQRLEEGQDDIRSTLARWKESERRVRQLEEDLRRIEYEAQTERDKHDEIVSRLEGERALDRELCGAEGRLKGAAALHSMHSSSNGSKQVVSQFVKDILQDNSNLQAGIAELRQLLQSSNEEVQNLREQIMLHQPVDEDETDVEAKSNMSLDQELHSAGTSPKKQQQEVHVHHHYHTKAPKPRVTMIRRPSKRRANMPGYGSISDSSTPSTPISQRQRYTSSPGLPLNLQQAQMQKNNRWSMQSTATMSSVLSSIPSSPRSCFDRGGSIFDRLEQGEEYSRPTSPESVADLLSPGPGQGQWRFRNETGNLDACEEEKEQVKPFDMSPFVESKPCFDVNDLPTPSDTAVELEPSDLDKELTPKPSILLQPSITEDASSEDKETDSYDTDQASASSAEPQLVLTQTAQVVPDMLEIRPTLTRKGSHETLVSISGMDIHIPQRASPTATLELLHRHFAHSPSQIRKVSAVQPMASVTEYTAISSPTLVTKSGSKPTLRDMPSSVDVLSEIATTRPKLATRSSTQTGAIGRLGGWVRGRWGIAPMKSSSNLRSVSYGQSSEPTAPSPSSSPTVKPQEVMDATTTSTTSTSEAIQAISVPVQNVVNPLHAKVDPAILFAGRSPGINQPGMIPGFRRAVMSKRTPSQVTASNIDEEGLKEGLAE